MKDTMLTDSQKTERIRTIQTKVLTRFMSPRQVEAFLAKYKMNLRHSFSRDRFARIQKPITRKENKILLTFIDTQDSRSFPEIEKEFGLKKFALAKVAGFIALKLIFQNQKKLKVDKLLVGGEEDE